MGARPLPRLQLKQTPHTGLGHLIFEVPATLQNDSESTGEVTKFFFILGRKGLTIFLVEELSHSGNLLASIKNGHAQNTASDIACLPVNFWIEVRMTAGIGDVQRLTGHGDPASNAAAERHSDSHGLVGPVVCDF